ncbi:DNA topoisomerase [Rhodosporidiobolus nylandii]
MVKWLCVAEKPSIAKAITEILSGGQSTRRPARNPRFISNYDFSYRMGPGPGHVDFTVTAVAGHLSSNDFDEQYRKWHSCDPRDLFDARVRTFIADDPDKKGIEANLIAEARRATHLMIWTDCDREGEFIGSIVAEVCRKARPNIVVKRARFSAIIPAQINQACRNPVDLDMQQAQAVAARMELDLRVGAIFTRMQTLELQRRIAAAENSLVSYGPCQFPTLGFVVDQYERQQAFVAEPFWSIHVALRRENSTTSFSWQRGRLFDHDVAQALFDICEAEGEATVLSQQTKPTQKWKPLPLTTVELQKSGSRLLRMTPKRILETAEALYQRGILSYPRTETDQFDRDFNFHELIQKQRNDGAWGAFAGDLLDNNGFERPRNGKKNDKAHPPIHPTAHVNNLAGDEKQVYELIVRRFLACCSKNARGLETTVDIDIAGERFKATGLIIQQRNYLDVYRYDKWNGSILPEFQVGERFVPDDLSLHEGQTTKPNLLTEADLVSLMDKNGIGTDATIAEHVAKIIEREYVMRQREGQIDYLVPSTLGIGLVKGYDRVGLENSLTKPHLRRLTEQRMLQICEGTKTKNDVINETLNEYRDVYFRTRQQLNVFIDSDLSASRRLSAITSKVPLEQARALEVVVGEAAEGQEEGAEEVDEEGAEEEGAAAAEVVGTPTIPTRTAAAAQGEGGAEELLEERERVLLLLGAARGKERREDEEGRRRNGSGTTTTTVHGLGGGGGNTPNCNCGTPAAFRHVGKEGPNKGRPFFGCPKPMDESCKFFAWADEDAGGGGGGGGGQPKKRPSGGGANQRQAPLNYDAPPDRCHCNLTPTELTSRKEGALAHSFVLAVLPLNVLPILPGPNQGRVFLKCPNVSKTAQCNYFAWADELDGSSGGGGGRAGPPGERSYGGGGGGGGGGGSGECFICHEEGHWSSNCPQKGQQGGGGGTGGGARSNSGGASGECYICHEAGHWSSNCPQKGEHGGAGRGGGGGGGAGGQGDCFICNEAGHWASACPQKGERGSGGRGGDGGSNTSCFKGHWSSACPNEDASGSSSSRRGRGGGRGSRGGGRARGGGRGKGRKASSDWD